MASLSMAARLAILPPWSTTIQVITLLIDPLIITRKLAEDLVYRASLINP